MKITVKNDKQLSDAILLSEKYFNYVGESINVTAVKVDSDGYTAVKTSDGYEIKYGTKANTGSNFHRTTKRATEILCNRKRISRIPQGCLYCLRRSFDVDQPLCGGYADDIVFKGNKNANDQTMTLVLTNCGKVDAEDCLVKRKNEDYKKELTIN